MIMVIDMTRGQRMPPNDKKKKMMVAERMKAGKGGSGGVVGRLRNFKAWGK